jgi:cytochrome d ubiquinol oxidase subunit II
MTKTPTGALWFHKFLLREKRRHRAGPFIFLGLGLAQYPHLVRPDVTLQHAAAPESTMKFLSAGAVVLLSLLLYLFQIFKGQEQR